jgi:hypothetical protein
LKLAFDGERSKSVGYVGRRLALGLVSTQTERSSREPFDALTQFIARNARHERSLRLVDL